MTAPSATLDCAPDLNKSQLAQSLILQPGAQKFSSTAPKAIDFYEDAYMIRPPRREGDYPDREIDCQEAMEAGFRRSSQYCGTTRSFPSLRTWPPYITRTRHARSWSFLAMAIISPAIRIGPKADIYR